MTLPRGIQPPNSQNFRVRFCRFLTARAMGTAFTGGNKTLLSSCGRLHLNPLSLAVAVASVPSKQLHETAA